MSIPEKPIGRLPAADRPGLVTWYADDIAARDAITQVAGVDITDDDISRVCRVGTAAPYRYFELVSSDPIEWAEVGAKGEPGEGAGGVTRFQVAFYAEAIVRDGSLIARYVVPPLDGGVVFSSSSTAAFVAADASFNANVSVNGETRMQLDYMPSTGSIAQVSEDFTVFAGDVIELRSLDEGGTEPATVNGAVTLFGSYDSTIVNPAGSVSMAAFQPNMVYTQNKTIGQSGSLAAAGIVTPQTGSPAVRVAVYSTVDDGNGNLVPDALLASSSAAVIQNGGASAQFASPVSVSEGDVIAFALWAGEQFAGQGRKDADAAQYGIYEYAATYDTDTPFDDPFPIDTASQGTTGPAVIPIVQT